MILKTQVMFSKFHYAIKKSSFSYFLPNNKKADFYALKSPSPRKIFAVDEKLPSISKLQKVWEKRNSSSSIHKWSFIIIALSFLEAKLTLTSPQC